MTRRIVLSGLVILFVIFIAALELSGTSQGFSNAASQVKDHLADRLETLRPITDQGSTSSDTPYCKWQFSRYEPSAYEGEWLGLVGQAQDHICATVSERRHAEASEKIVGRVLQLTSVDKSIKWRMVDSMLPAALDPADQYMSRMHYSRACYDKDSRTFKPASGHGEQLIEPLWGMLRDPFDVHCQESKLTMTGWPDGQGQSKAHIMAMGFAPYRYDVEAQRDSLDSSIPWRPHGIPPWHSSLKVENQPDVGVVYTKPKNVHLDLGSSYFAGWSESGEVNLAASGQYFYETYHARGQEFDRFVAVELDKLDDDVAYSQVPVDLVGKYTLMNVGLTMDKGDKLNTVDMIRRLVRPEDFFVFKLDIDSAPIEMPIIEDILSSDGIADLVDELMFEHHVDYAPMDAAWLTKLKGITETLEDSYNLFKRLREKGIRAHSWP